MRRNLSHIIAAAFNEPLLLEPAYARVFFCALGREMGAVFRYHNNRYSLMLPECWLKRTSIWPEVNDRPVFTGW